MNDNQLHTDIAGLRADLQSTNRNVERIASALEKTLDDHEGRLRNLEEHVISSRAVIGLVKWLGPVTVAGLIFVLAKQFGA